MGYHCHQHGNYVRTWTTLSCTIFSKACMENWKGFYVSAETTRTVLVVSGTRDLLQICEDEVTAVIRATKFNTRIGNLHGWMIISQRITAISKILSLPECHTKHVGRGYVGNWLQIELLWRISSKTMDSIFTTSISLRGGLLLQPSTQVNPQSQVTCSLGDF